MDIEQKDRIKRPLVKDMVSTALYFSDIIAIVLSFLLALCTTQFIQELNVTGVNHPPLFNYVQIHDLFFVWICPLVLFMFIIKGHYTQRVPWWSQVQSVMSICLLAFIMDGFIRFAFDIPFSRLLIGLSWIYVFFLTLTGRQIVYMIALKKGVWDIPAIVIGDIATVTDILFAFNTDPYTGYHVNTISLRDRADKKFDISSLPKKYRDIAILRKQIDYRLFIEKNIDHFFVISLETFRGKERDDLINALNSLNVQYAIVPPRSRISSFEMEPRHFFGYDVTLLHARGSVFSPVGRFIKRSMDIVLASIALICLSPLMLLATIFLKIEGQSGSIFYGGYRIGRRGNKFKCWKFRSMEPNSDHLLHDLLERNPAAKAEWEEFRKLKQPDPRVTTKTARIIRRTSIDELPQLWNVIKGDMSLVGPRPILEDEIELFGTAINQYLQVRPGITGLWQVSGRNDVNFERRVYWDSWYVRNWSVWGDIVILIKTLRVVLGSSGAY